MEKLNEMHIKFLSKSSNGLPCNRAAFASNGSTQKITDIKLLFEAVTNAIHGYEDKWAM